MKRLTAFLLSTLMVIAMLPVSSITAYALDSRVEKAISWAIAIANDNSHGYSQANRNGPDYDCSSFVSTAFKNGGFSVSGSLNTSSMKAAFEKVGFTSYKKSEVTIQRGDILLKPGSHVELNLGNNTCVAAHSNYDGKTGDGNGKEIQVRTKSYCTFCKQANYTYVLRYNGITTNSYTYSFNFNANGGSLGTTGAFTTSYGKDFQILNTTCTRSGYTWAGWTVKRNNDNKWYVAGKGWCTDSQISTNGYSKKVYSNYQTCTLDDSWTNGISGNGSYTFYAVWIKSRVDTLKVFLSPYGKDCDHVTALNNSTGAGYAQNQIYAWYILYDGNTGDLMNTYSNKTYSVELAVHDPNGNLVFNYTYTDSNDANWIGVTPQMSGTYTATATISGAYTGSISTTYDVSYDADLISSCDSVSLNLNGNNTSTITFTPTNGYPGNMGVSYNYDHSIIEKVSGSWSNKVFSLSIKGLKYGSTNIVMNLYENYTGNKNVVATVTVPVIVTANTYTITYNANGGTGAPAAQTKTFGQTLTLSPTKPTRTGHTFLGWSASSSATSATYSAGGAYTANSGATLYAVWKADTYTVSYNANGGTGAPTAQTKTYGQTLTLSNTKPSRTGYTFLGWATNSSATNVTYSSGSRYTSNSDITLYAIWEKADTIYGDCGDKVKYVYKLSSGLVNVQASAGNSSTYENIYDFDGDTNVQWVTFQSGVINIGNYMFRDCTALNRLDLHSTSGNLSCVQVIGTCAFMGCNSLTEVSLPDGLKTIKNLAFADSGLTAITIPQSVTEIGSAAFDSDVVIYGYMNSEAQKYAEKNGNKFVALDAPQLTSIAIAQMPYQIDYYIGDAIFNTSGLQLKLIYSNGSTEVVSSGFTTTGFNSVSAGAKTITVVYSGKTTSFGVNVKTPSISLSATNKSLKVGETATLIATTTPTAQTVTWISSNTSVAMVSNGVITAKGAGTATITAKFVYNGTTYSKTCSVTVNETVLLGDINGDESIDAGDAGLISRYDTGLITLTSEQLKVGDVNGDGVVDAGDAGVISRYDAGLISQIGY